MTWKLYVTQQFDPMPNHKCLVGVGDLNRPLAADVSTTVVARGEVQDEKCEILQNIPAGDHVWYRSIGGSWVEIFRWHEPAHKYASWSTWNYPPAGDWKVTFGGKEILFTLTGKESTKLIEEERKDREAADTKLGDRIAALEKWAGTQIMEVLASIQDIVERAEQEATAWRAGLQDLESRITAWIMDSVLRLLLSHADAAAERVVANYTGTIPEGPDWNRTAEEKNASKISFPFDPERLRTISEDIANLRQAMWKLDRGKM